MGRSRNPGWPRRRVLGLLVTLLGHGHSYAERAVAKPGAAALPKESFVNPHSPYPAAFGGPRRTSRQPVALRLRGEMAWQAALGIPAHHRPREILACHGVGLLQAGEAVLAFEPAGGRLRWRRDKRPDSPMALLNDELFYESPLQHLESVGVDGQARRARLPFPGNPNLEYQVVQFWPDEAGFVTTIVEPDPKYDSEDKGAGGKRPKAWLRASRYGAPTSDTNHEFSGQPRLPTLYLPESRRWVMDLDGQTTVAEAGRRGLPRSRPRALDETMQWSADETGRLYLTGRIGLKRRLACTGLDGAPAWHWDDPASEDDPWSPLQPPSPGPDFTLALTAGRLLAIRQGELAWTFDARSDSLRHGANVNDGSFEVRDGRLLAKGRLQTFTVLSDGSVLLAGERTLWQLDAQGRVLARLAFEETLAAVPPVANGDGLVYVATATRLIAVR